MARNRILNLSEENFTGIDFIVGQANNSGLATTQLRDRGATADGLIFTHPIALETGKMVGMKSDGLIYLASAEAGAGQVVALGLNFQERANGQPVDIIGMPRTIELAVAPTSAAAGKLAYLSDVNPGEIVAVAPVGTGKIVQVIGRFLSPTIVRTDFQSGNAVTL